MPCWNLKDVKAAFDWAREHSNNEGSIKELAHQIGRSPGAVREFLRRTFPPGERPWMEKPRWRDEEVEALAAKGHVEGRSDKAVFSFVRRTGCECKRKGKRQKRGGLTITQVANDLGISRKQVRKLIRLGYLRRFKHGIAESAFEDLLKNHPEVIPYQRLSRERKEWLVLHGYPDPSIKVKRPSSAGLLEE